MKTLFALLLTTVITFGQNKQWTGTSTNLWPRQQTNFVISSGAPLLSIGSDATIESGSLLELKNNGTNQVAVTFDGGILSGELAPSWVTPSADNYYPLYSVRPDNGSSAFSTIGIQHVDGTNSVSSALLQSYSGYGALELQSADSNNGLELLGSANGSSLIIKKGGAVGTRLEPNRTGTGTPYEFFTSVTHTAGDLLAVDNHGTNKFSVSFDGKLTTSDPGSGAGAWQFGKKITGASVTLVTTNYVELKIDGATVKLAIVQ